MGGERAKPDAVRWNAEHDARMASMRVVWLVACPALAPGVCAFSWRGQEAKSGQKSSQEQNQNEEGTKSRGCSKVCHRQPVDGEADRTDLGLELHVGTLGRSVRAARGRAGLPHLVRVKG